MPFTFLAHQAVVLPLKIARPSRVSGTALVIGSMAPDVEAFIVGAPSRVIGHTMLGQLVFCLPLTLLLYLLVTRLVLEPTAARLPDAGGFHLRDYALAGRHERVPWVLVVASALLGSLSHVAWDAFTHADGLPVRMLPLLRWPVYERALRPVPLFEVLQMASTVVGAVATLLLLGYIGRWRLPILWRAIGYEAATGERVAEAGRHAAELRGKPSAPMAAGASRFWVVVFAFAAAGAAWGMARVELPAVGGPYEMLRGRVLLGAAFLRGSSMGFVGLCVASWLARRGGVR